MKAWSLLGLLLGLIVAGWLLAETGPTRVVHLLEQAKVSYMRCLLLPVPGRTAMSYQPAQHLRQNILFRTDAPTRADRSTQRQSE
jgi:hypothetical protein